MKKLSKNEKGFSAVETIIVLVIIALICVAGLIIFRNHHKTTTVTNTTSLAFYTCVNNGGIVSPKPPIICSLNGVNNKFSPTFSTEMIKDFIYIPTAAQPVVISTTKANVLGSCTDDVINGTEKYYTGQVQLVASNYVTIGFTNCDDGFIENFELDNGTWSSGGAGLLPCLVVKNYNLNVSNTKDYNPNTTVRGILDGCV